MLTPPVGRGRFQGGSLFSTGIRTKDNPILLIDLKRRVLWPGDPSIKSGLGTPRIEETHEAGTLLDLLALFRAELLPTDQTVINVGLTWMRFPYNTVSVHRETNSECERSLTEGVPPGRLAVPERTRRRAQQ